MQSATKPFMQEVMEGKVCIAQNIKSFANTQKFRCFQPQTTLKYEPFCDDFGPMNISSVTQFIELLDAEIEACKSGRVVYLVDSGKRALTNAVFLLGSYMIIKNDMTSEGVMKCFQWLDTDNLVEPFRDATFSAPDFGLTLMDCWEGLERGKMNGWVQMQSPPGLWGLIDINEYEHYDNTLNGDLHAVVPNKFIAFRGPVDLGGGEYRDIDGYRQFSPGYYIDAFRDLGVTTVVRLNEPLYDRDEFVAAGIDHHDLEFEDCTSPPPRVVDAFLAIVDAAPGAVAVHCKAGLGRTGTLIALYMMRSCGFTARQAIGWLRIVRPGSVIGEQQHYLTGLEARSRRRAAAAADATAAAVAAAAAATAAVKGPAAVLAAQVAAGMERRAVAGGGRLRMAAPAAVTLRTKAVPGMPDPGREAWAGPAPAGARAVPV